MDYKWLEARRKGIGGSDAPAICGVSPWKTPLQVYMDKIGDLGPKEDTDPMFWGRTLEPVIRQRYADLTGRAVVVPDGILQHPEHDWMLANVDGLTDDGRLVEVKTARTPQGWGDEGTDEIPEMYLIQVQHYLSITKLEVADIPVLFGGSDFRIYEVQADKELQDLIMEREAGFWKLVQARTPPDPVTFADIKLKYGYESREARIAATDEIIQAIHRLHELKALSDEEEALKTKIMLHLKEADTLVDGESVLATWKASVKPVNRFDAKAFEVEHPDLYKKFLKESTASRRFLLKPIK